MTGNPAYPQDGQPRPTTASEPTPSLDSEPRCDWCHPLTGREPGREVIAGCVNEHLTPLILCCCHERGARTHTLWCQQCRNAGYDQVPVTVITAPLEVPCG